MCNNENLKDLGEKVATFAHEICNRLASIRAGAQRIEQKISSLDPNRKYTQIIIREVDHLEQIVKAFLGDMCNREK